jgi:hypothetical protein
MSPSSVLLRGIKALATINEDLGEIHDAAIYIEGNLIKWVGKPCDIGAEMRAAAEQVIEC